MDALLLIDLQKDFFPEGALPVPEAHHIFPLANKLQDHFDQIIATKDWHPKHHKSFAAMHPGHSPYDVITLHGLDQVLWPNHCIQESEGAAFHPQLNTDRIKKIIYKGTDPEIDSYSGFFDNAHQKDTGLNDYLKEQHINTLYIMGLATDYCVLYSVLDARHLGFATYVIVDGCFGLDKQPGDVQAALQKMRSAGAIIIHSEILMRERKKIHDK